MNLRRADKTLGTYVLSAERVLAGERLVLDEKSFQRMLSLERKRTERSRKPFLLMLLRADGSLASPKRDILNNIGAALLASTRETDITGWYEDKHAIGVLFTEIAIADKHSVLSSMLARITATLKSGLTSEQFNQVSISFHLFPDDWHDDVPHFPVDSALYPDLAKRAEARKVFSVLKRIIDVAGSVFALVATAPVFLAVAFAVKFSSKGPIVFRQTRVGQHGKRFTFLKFRSMYVGNDSTAHEAYVKQLIAGQAERKHSDGIKDGVYKLTSDSRITRVGAWLRQTSLDELPQLLNVLKGEMSLVGPRPPLPYEVEAYEIWHRRRLVEAKPGITGLWQVSGRNRIGFDDMVRLDLVYARTSSPWLDLNILLRTPLAVIEGGH